MSVPNPPGAGHPAPPPAAPYGGPPPAASYGAPLPAPSGPLAPGKKNVVALIAMITAIVGFVFACIPGALIVGWILLPIAFVLSIVSLFLKGERKWMGIVGLIVSVVGTVVGFIVFFAVVATAVDQAFGSGDTTVSAPAEQESDAETEGDVTEEESAAPADARQELALVETAFGRNSYDRSTWWYVAIFENPNKDYVFANSGITVEGLDGEGTILDSSSDYRTILAGRSAVAGQFFEVGDGEIVNLEVRGPAATDATRSPAAETGGFEIKDVMPTTDSYSTTVRGKVTSSFSTDQEFVQAVVVARDANGLIVGADSGHIDRLPSGGTAQFEVMFFDPMPEGTTYEAYAIL